MPNLVSFSEMKTPQSKVTIPETTKNDTSLDSPRDRGGTIQYKPERDGKKLHSNLLYIITIWAASLAICLNMCAVNGLQSTVLDIISIGLVMKC